MTFFPILALIVMLSLGIGGRLGASEVEKSTSRIFESGISTFNIQLSTSQRLEPYDAFLIRCPLRPALQTTVNLNSLGVGALPSGELLVLAGLTLDEATAKVKKFLEGETGSSIGPFSLIPTANPKAPIRFSGEVKFAGTTFASKGRKLSEILTEAQPTDMADLNAIQIRSGIDSLVFDSAKEDPDLKAGDRVFVPRQVATKQVFVLGAVKKPGGFPYAEGITAKRAVELAGGASAPGDLSQVRIDRHGNSLGSLDFSFGDTPLQVGDTVTVPFKSNAPFVMVVGGAVRPGRVFFEEGLTLRKAIEAVGGAKLTKGKVKIVRHENGKSTTQILELAAILRGHAPDVLLKPNDRIELPEGLP